MSGFPLGMRIKTGWRPVPGDKPAAGKISGQLNEGARPGGWGQEAGRVFLSGMKRFCNEINCPAPQKFGAGGGIL